MDLTAAAPDIVPSSRVDQARHEQFVGYVRLDAYGTKPRFSPYVPICSEHEALVTRRI